MDFFVWWLILACVLTVMLFGGGVIVFLWSVIRKWAAGAPLESSGLKSTR